MISHSRSLFTSFLTIFPTTSLTWQHPHIVYYASSVCRILLTSTLFTLFLSFISHLRPSYYPFSHGFSFHQLRQHLHGLSCAFFCRSFTSRSFAFFRPYISLSHSEYNSFIRVLSFYINEEIFVESTFFKFIFGSSLYHDLYCMSFQHCTDHVAYTNMAVGSALKFK